jgi:stearoyl-CoA desaturase (Delta-9 desaturase)
LTQVATRAASAPVSGITVLSRRQARLQRFALLVMTVGPFAGFVAAVWLLWGTGITPVDFSIFLLTYLLTGLGVTIGFHRLFTHGSFQAGPRLRAVLAVAGSMALEGSVIDWVAAHRRHHAYSDRAGDPHSPHLEESDGLGGMVRGLWHAHMGWLFDVEKTSRQRWAPDLLKDRTIVAIDKRFGRLTAASLLLPAVLGLVLTRSLWGAVTAFLWGGLARVFLLHHVTWSVNSICHFYGKRPFETKDESTNNWLLSLLSFGESWHNNHHAFPTSARHGLGRGQIDVSASIIGALARAGLVRGVKAPSQKQLSSKRVA